MASVLQHAQDPVMWKLLPGRQPESQLPTLSDLAKLFHTAGYQRTIVGMLKEKLTSTIITEIFNETKRRYLCPLWRNQRIGALTSTTLHKAARYKGSDPDNYVVQEIIGESKFYGNQATVYGHKNEGVARKLCEKRMNHKHKCFQVKSSGLVINRDNPI